MAGSDSSGPRWGPQFFIFNKHPWDMDEIYLLVIPFKHPGSRGRHCSVPRTESTHALPFLPPTQIPGFSARSVLPIDCYQLIRKPRNLLEAGFSLPSLLELYGEYRIRISIFVVLVFKAIVPLNELIWFGD